MWYRNFTPLLEMTDKTLLRREALRIRRSLVASAREELNYLVFDRAHKVKAYQKASVIHVYMSLPDEVDTKPFIEYAWATGKTVVVPVFSPEGLFHAEVTRRTKWTRGFGGIEIPDSDFTPLTPNHVQTDLTLMIVPIVAFDASCRRLGMGMGVYDSLIRELSWKTLGLAYEVLRFPEIPVEPHDAVLNMIATERNTYAS